MIILFGILIFIIGCCMSASAEDYKVTEQYREKRHKEIMRAITSKKNNKIKVTRRRILKDKEGNTIAEEIIEETE